MKKLLIGEGARRFANMFPGYDVVFLPEDERLGKVVRSHADTLVFSAGGAALMNREYAARLGIPERPVGPGNGIFTQATTSRAASIRTTRASTRSPLAGSSSGGLTACLRTS
ncbi:MAG: hypothetical protein ACLR5G_13475 [Eubacteriales bacterium]